MSGAHHLFSVSHTQLQEFFCFVVQTDIARWADKPCDKLRAPHDTQRWPSPSGSVQQAESLHPQTGSFRGWVCVLCVCVCVCVCVCANTSNSYLVLYLMSDVLTLPHVMYIPIFRGASWGDTWSKSGGRGPQAAENRFEKSTKGQCPFLKLAAVCSFVPDVMCSQSAVLLSSSINFGIYFIYF